MKLPCLKLLCFFIILSINIVQRGNGMPEDGLWRGAVLELKQHNDATSSGREIIDKNLGIYDVSAALSKENDVDMIVYPEKGPFPQKPLDPTWFLSYAEDVPTGRENANPCNDENFSNSPILRNFSCIAQKYNIYVVATLIDIKKCKVRTNCKNKRNRNSCVTNPLGCPIKGHFYFNTLVVFNRNGTLIVRYYKRHPFIPLDLLIETPKYPQPGYFKTEFGYFATQIGFDTVYNDTVIDIKRRPMPTGLAYGNWWFDHTPFYYFGVPIQQAFSRTNNIAVLSSDVHSPNSGSLGSGIYLPGIGAVIYSYNPDGKSKLLISNVPTSYSDAPIDTDSLDTKFFYIADDGTVSELNGEEPRDFKEECGENVLGMKPTYSTDYRCKQSRVDQYTFVKLNKTEDYINICSNNFCCSLEYEADSMDETFYFAVSGNRLKFYEVYWFGVQSCFLARCEPVDGQPCRNFLLKSKTLFRKFKMTGSFQADIIYPHVLDSKLRLTNVHEYDFDGKSQLSYQNLYGNYLLFANMYGRQYKKDDLTIAGKAAEIGVSTI